MNSVCPPDRANTGLAPISIAAGDLVAEIHGGPLLTVTSLQYHGVEMLVRPTELPLGYRVHAERAGITLLHPWANRLGADEYHFDGITAQLDRTDPTAEAAVTRDATGLAIHGLIAPWDWRPELDGEAACRATLTWLGTPAFPFPHQVLVRLSIGEDDSEPGVGLRVTTTITALSSTLVPVSFGWHPYFRCDRRLGAALDLPGVSVLETDKRGLPTGTCVPRGPTRFGLDDQFLDYGALLLGGEMVMHQSAADGPGHLIAVAFDQGYPYGQVFAPADAPVISLEPMTAPTDALRRRSGLPVAAADRPYTAEFTVRVRRRELAGADRG